jgi:hypothetical protein
MSLPGLTPSLPQRLTPKHKQDIETVRSTACKVPPHQPQSDNPYIIHEICTSISHPDSMQSRNETPFSSDRGGEIHAGHVPVGGPSTSNTGFLLPWWRRHGNNFTYMSCLRNDNLRRRLALQETRDAKPASKLAWVHDWAVRSKVPASRYTHNQRRDRKANWIPLSLPPRWTLQSLPPRSYLDSRSKYNRTWL